MLLTKEVEIELTNNVKYYENLGYKIPRVLNKKNKLKLLPHTKIVVKVEDLSVGSKATVEAICDYCNKNLIQIEYYDYNKRRKTLKKDSCKECIPLKTKEVNLLKYGVEHINQLPENKMKISLRKVGNDEKIISEFFNKGYQVTKIDRLNLSKWVYIYYICNKHQDKGELRISYNAFKRGQGCRYCSIEHRAENQRGENSNFWKGGVNSLNNYLRNSITQWKNDSLEHFGHKCCLTGNKNNLDIHHIYSFNRIVEEVLKTLNLPLRDNVSNYSQEELNSLAKLCLELHYKYGYGVVITRDIHRLYHSIYGQEDGTIKEFNEFCHNNFGIKFNTKNLSVSKVQEYKKNDKYFPSKINATSKFTYVSQYTKSSSWQYFFRYKGKPYISHAYQDELECAYDVNQLLISIKGEQTTINYLSPEEMKYVQQLKLNRNKIIVNCLN